MCKDYLKQEYQYEDLIKFSKKSIIQELKSRSIEQLGCEETIISIEMVNQLVKKSFIEIDELRDIEFNYENCVILEGQSFLSIIFSKDDELYNAIIDINTERLHVIAKKTKNDIYVYHLLINKWIKEGESPFLNILKEVR